MANLQNVTAASQLTVSQCTGVTNGENLYWLDGSIWTPVSPAATYDSTTKCLTVVLNSTSSPTLSDLSGTVFAAATPIFTGGGGGGGYAAALPQVTGIGPSSGPAAGGTQVTLSGSGFTGATAVDFGTNAATNVQVQSDTEIMATSPAGTGTVDVTVVTPAGTSATSSADQFTYTVASKPTPHAVSFSDVPPSFWAYADIEQLASKGIIDGFPDGTFQPNGNVTRAQFVKMLVLTLGMAPGTGTTPFTDVAPGAWYAPYLSAAVEAGIVNGLTPATFGPNETLTREQMALLLARALKLTKAATLHFSDDGMIGAWATVGVAETVAAGYIDGFPNGTFQPLGTATRAQAAKVLAMVLAKS